MSDYYSGTKNFPDYLKLLKQEVLWIFVYRYIKINATIIDIINVMQTCIFLTLFY